MYGKKVLALGGALVVAGAATASSSAAAGPAVTVRVEGKSKTLLASTLVKPHSGAVTVSGHSCPASGGAGADAVALATHNAWSGKWFSFGLQVEKILGETDDYTTTKSYWELFVDNVASPSGICDVTLHRGEQILFAAVPATGSEFPLALSAPAHVSAGTPFTVTVTAFNARGKAKPLAGATVGGQHTDSHGHATITLAHAGKVTVTTTDKGYIRAETQIRVS
jgi:hypothetical protein